MAFEYEQILGIYIVNKSFCIRNEWKLFDVNINSTFNKCTDPI